MMLVLAGCSFRNTPVALRERLAFDGARLAQALDELDARYACEAVLLSTCNRVEIYIGRADVERGPDPEVVAEFLAEFHGLPIEEIHPHLYFHKSSDAVNHLFRVGASLDSMIVGEGQIGSQVRQAYEAACTQDTAGPLMHALFQHAFVVAKRVRSETGIAQGRVSVSSVAVDYVKNVFERFDDKTILVIGAGKMGELTLRHLRDLNPQRILVSNRSPEKAESLARECDGTPVPFEQLDDALVAAHIVLSTTGSPEPIMPRRRFNDILRRRTAGPMVILDIAVPRDFDPRIHDGDRTFLFNIDDLQKIRDQTLRERAAHIAPAEAIVVQEVNRFEKEWKRRRVGPIIQQLTEDFETKKKEIVEELMSFLNGRLTEEDRRHIEKAFSRLQNKILHGPISALSSETHQELPHGGHSLLEALRKLFRLRE
jgi:glutamyl-tRNA reductase